MEEAQEAPLYFSRIQILFQPKGDVEIRITGDLLCGLKSHSQNSSISMSLVVILD